MLPLAGVFYDYNFVRSNWSLAWFFLLALCVFNFNKLKEDFNLPLLLLILLQTFGLMGYYFFAADNIYQWLFFVTPAVRNTLQYMPIAVFLIGRMVNVDDLKLALAAAAPSGKKKR